MGDPRLGAELWNHTNKTAKCLHFRAREDIQALSFGVSWDLACAPSPDLPLTAVSCKPTRWQPHVSCSEREAVSERGRDLVN